jgi:protein SCO1/2
MRGLRIALWVLVAIAFVGFIALSLPDRKSTNETPAPTQPIAGFNKGEHFILTTHTGETFNSDREIGEGEYALLFFGFTHCPVICPTELQKFAEVMDSLPSDTRKKVKPLFITIDPERDTQEALQDYVPLFHPAIVGLTGNMDEIEPVLDAWKIYYAKVDDPQFSEYTMDHSTYSYLVDNEMNILALFRMKTSVEEMENTISAIVASNN